MARAPRAVLPGVPLHITQRGIDRVRTFHDSRDYSHYRQLLTEVACELACDVHAYALMPNHVHLLLTPPESSSAARMMQRLGTRYVRYVNAVYRRTGALWEGRYRSTVIDSDPYLLRCMRYIDLNPVRAGVVSDPGLSTWSSYRHNALGEPDPLVREHPVFLGLGRSTEEARGIYAAMCRSAPDASELRDLRRGIGIRGARMEARAGTEFELARGVMSRAWRPPLLP